jgi:hypothetical protein
MTKRKIYIAGPMRGIPQFNFPAFDAAAKELRSYGWEVTSPADLEREAAFDPSTLPIDHDWSKVPEWFSLDDAIERDLRAIREADAIYMLKGWEQSMGAKAEKSIAEWREIKVMYQEPPSATDGQTIVNEKGGKQSFISARFDCIPAIVLRLLAQCLGFGARKYGKENWKQIPIEDNIAHAMNHLNEWTIGDRSEPHLVNALARTSFALTQAVEAGQQEATYRHPDEVKHGSP